MINTIRLSNKSSVYLETKKRKKIKRSDIFRDDQRVAIIHKYRPEASTLRYWWHAFIRVTCQGVSVSFFPSLSLSVSLPPFFILYFSSFFSLSRIFPNWLLQRLLTFSKISTVSATTTTTTFFSMTDSFIHWARRRRKGKNYDRSTPAESPKIVNGPILFNYFHWSVNSIWM